MDELEPQEERKKSGLTKEQRVGLVLLSAFAIMAVGLGILQLRNTLYEPFALNSSIPATIKTDINSTEALQLRDTDRDGISDFDEMYIYSTSAYLADSDSDSIPDKQEIDSGSDPLCAVGKDCSAMVENPDAALVRISSTSSKITGTALELSVTGEKPIDLEQALKDPKQIRQLLLTSGMDPKVLQAVSDANLMLLVGQAMSLSGTSTNNISNLNNVVKTPIAKPVATTTKK
ncbi:MAG: hypothetical protein Q7S24_01690 [bacterium]|nr:hypothetical protein [bacterium]